MIERLGLLDHARDISLCIVGKIIDRGGCVAQLLERVDLVVMQEVARVFTCYVDDLDEALLWIGGRRSLVGRVAGCATTSKTALSIDMNFVVGDLLMHRDLCDAAHINRCNGYVSVSDKLFGVGIECRVVVFEAR